MGEKISITSLSMWDSETSPQWLNILSYLDKADIHQRQSQVSNCNIQPLGYNVPILHNIFDRFLVFGLIIIFFAIIWG